MDLKELEFIVAIADYGSVTKAAEQLYVSQPTLSYTLAQAEQHLGLQLFHRYPRQFTPTEIGEHYLKAAREILAVRNEFQKKASDYSQFQAGRIRIGLAARRSPGIAPAFYAAFHEEYPNIEVFFADETQLVLENMLEKDQLDIILCSKSNRKKSFSHVVLEQQTFLLAVPKDHPLNTTAQVKKDHPYPWVDLKAFVDEKFLLQASFQGQRYFSDILFQQCRISPRKIMIVENIETATRMAGLGAGISFVFDSYVKTFYFDPKPAYFSVGEKPFQVDFSAIYKKNAYFPAYMHRALELLKEIVREGC